MNSIFQISERSLFGEWRLIHTLLGHIKWEVVEGFYSSIYSANSLLGRKYDSF